MSKKLVTKDLKAYYLKQKLNLLSLSREIDIFDSDFVWRMQLIIKNLCCL